MLCIILLALYIIFYFFKCNLLECTGRANIFIYNKIFGLLRRTNFVVNPTLISVPRTSWIWYTMPCVTFDFSKHPVHNIFWCAFLRNYKCENCMVDDSLYNFAIDILFSADLAFSLTHYLNRINWFPCRIF